MPSPRRSTPVARAVAAVALRALTSAVSLGSRVAAFSAASPGPPASPTPACPPSDPAAPGKTARPTSVAVVGAGAVGSYYGGRLWEAAARRRPEGGGAHVSFHLRGEHYDHCVEHGMDVSSYHGDFHIPPGELAAFRTTEDMARSVVGPGPGPGPGGGGDGDGGGFDWVVCALKSTSVSAIARPWTSTSLLVSRTNPGIDVCEMRVGSSKRFRS